MEWYYILGIISYSIFIIQFVMSFIGSDIDLDVDFDGNIDFSLGDLISFKGLIHFLMGFSSWLIITGKITAVSITCASLIGVGFVVILYFVYKMIMKLNYEPTPYETAEDLIGYSVTVSYPIIDDYHCIAVVSYNGMEVGCYSDKPLKSGDVLTIKSYDEGIYFIL